MAAAVAGVALGITLLAAGALLLYTGEGVLGSAGFLMALALGALAAGVWVGAPYGAAPSHRRTLGRWMLAVGSLVVASFTAMAWLRYPALQLSAFGPPLALVLLMAEPAYAIGSLVAALEARYRGGGPSVGRPVSILMAHPVPPVHQRGRGSAALGMVIPVLLGTAVGMLVAAFWLIPMLPPGPVFIGAALLLAMAGTVEMRSREAAPAVGRLEGVVLVTGVGGRGQVGYALTQAFLDQGARVVMAGRSAELVSYAEELGEHCVAARADLETAAGAAEVVEAARSRWGRLDAVVNAAGGLRVIKPLAETTAEEWDDELGRNARTAFLVSRAALPLLRESRGAIVNFTSPSVLAPVKKLGAYTAGKAAVVALTRAMALEEREHGVRVNAIAPGMIDTESNRAAVGDPATVDWVSRDDVAAAAIFLAGDAGSAFTAQVVNVEGKGSR